jgi:hypothetical protein
MIFAEPFHLIGRWIFEPRWHGRILSELFGWRAEMRGGWCIRRQVAWKANRSGSIWDCFTAFFLCTKQSVFSAKDHGFSGFD